MFAHDCDQARVRREVNALDRARHSLNRYTLSFFTANRVEPYVLPSESGDEPPVVTHDESFGINGQGGDAGDLAARHVPHHQGIKAQAKERAPVRTEPELAIEPVAIEVARRSTERQLATSAELPQG